MPPSSFLAKVRKALCLGSSESSHPVGINLAAQDKSLAPDTSCSTTPTPPTSTLPTLDPSFHSAASPAQPTPPCEAMPTYPPPAVLTTMPSWSELRRVYSSAPSQARAKPARRTLISETLSPVAASAVQPLPLHATRHCRSISQPINVTSSDTRSGPALSPTILSASHSRSCSCSATPSARKAAASAGRSARVAQVVQASWSQPHKTPSPSTRPLSCPIYPQHSLLELRKALQLGPPSLNAAAPHKPRPRSGLESFAKILQTYSSGRPVAGVPLNEKVLRRYSSLGQGQGMAHQGLVQGVQDEFLNSA